MKRAILVVSFGTTYEDTRKVTIDAIEEKVKEHFREFEVRRAFTSHGIIKILKNRDNIYIDTPEEALKKLAEEGIEEVLVQPLHIIPGSEYDYINQVVEEYKRENAFKKIVLGRPVIFYHEDYEILIDAIKGKMEREEAVIFMGHGSSHYANACYCCLQNILKDKGYDNVFIGTVEGYPSILDAVTWVRTKDIKKVKLLPLMLVAGDHAKNDMWGEEDSSWKNILKVQGVEVSAWLHGLGEIEEFQNIYIQHIKEALDME